MKVKSRCPASGAAEGEVCESLHMRAWAHIRNMMLLSCIAEDLAVMPAHVSLHDSPRQAHQRAASLEKHSSAGSWSQIGLDGKWQGMGADGWGEARALWCLCASDSMQG